MDRAQEADHTASSPQDATGSVRVLAAVIRHDDRYLVCRRPAHKRHGGLWEFPGGKIDDGESLLDAARRELAEELSIDVTHVGATLVERRDSGSQFVILFVEVAIHGEPVALEHDEICWLPRDEILRLDLAPADRYFAESFLSR
jgi:mutator protein MutT